MFLNQWRGDVEPRPARGESMYLSDLEKEIDNLLQYLTVKKQEEDDDFGFSKENEENYV